MSSRKIEAKERSEFLNMKKKLSILIISVFCIGLIFTVSPLTASAVNIVKGDTVENIQAVQTRLKDLGLYTYAIDGIWGSRTLSAVKAFQTQSNLVADGIVGSKTESALGLKLTSSTASDQYNSTSSADLDLLARCVYAEARGEPYTGQVAVAAVVLNRKSSSQFPNTISGIIYQPYAFTAVADGQINLRPDDNAYQAARDALNGWDPTNGCLYYYNPATATSKWIWSLTVELTIGRHSFARA